ncbi:DUF58 domain-containing protein [Methylorubrum sp. GM97]|jgi:uncharacterized protein (DUF58 family)|uniref:DUF58 domain-containing protein n=1 Tax=Methylorubrum sp. GM97 TaxID=2938232 RepID=UPI00218C6699|nr:DUF58 domain-containing protein [Methylorubrum sp. GM97]BDL37513.1 hypothetical protein MSPGM_01030 [Methylorubrum sp. GM97]
MPHIASHPNGTMAERARAYVDLAGLMRLKHRATGFSFLPRQPVHSLLYGRHASRLRGRGLSFEELRGYVEGDDTRTIDWGATARLGKPYVRVYTEERDRPVILLIDQRPTMFFGSRRATKSVVAAEAAALAAWRVASLGDRVGAVLLTPAGLVAIRPDARERAIRRILDETVRANRALSARTEGTGAPSQLNEGLRRVARMVPHDGLVCLITDGAGSDAETVELVTNLTAHNDVIFLFVHDPLEADLPDLGPVVVSDGGREIEVDTASKGLRERFGEVFADRRDRLEAFSRKRAIPVLPIRTDRDVAEQVRELLGRRRDTGLRGVSLTDGAAR